MDEKGSYVPARPGATVVVPAGDVYIHNRSGRRKATGSYFTKQFAVEHLPDTAPATRDRGRESRSRQRASQRESEC